VHADVGVRQAHLARIDPTKTIPLSLRGMQLSQQLWDEIVRSPVFDKGVPSIPISFAYAEISAAIRLDDREFEHWLDFTGAELFSHLELRRCSFLESINVKYCFFNVGAINCAGSTFHKDFDISYSRTERVSFSFQNCTFHGAFTADGTDGAFHLMDSDIKGKASFRHAKATLMLDRAKLRGYLDVTNSKCVSITGEELVAEAVSRLGPCEVQSMRLNRASFSVRTHMDFVAAFVDLSGATFEQGGLLEVDGAKVDLKQLSLGGPFRVSGKLEAKGTPEILSLLNADAGEMSFARVNMSKCSFYGAHGLGNVNIEATVQLSRSPWWAGRRKLIADELAWRRAAGRLHSTGWNVDGDEAAGPMKGGKLPVALPVLVAHRPPVNSYPPLEASQVASMYRELRRSLESKSDMPGAADFYYGEMEMRRWSKQSGIGERILVGAYWLLSGYGLRPLRALLAWTAVVIFGVFEMKAGGFVSGCYSPCRALIFSVRASLPGISTTEQLTPVGQAIEIVIRVLGPMMLALFLISIRAKLMRKPSE
jgi:uncharacterized protein YjbI with pentapeptide repeats